MSKSARALPSKPAAANRSYLGVPHDTRSQERRERLLAAGIEVFGSIGVRRATVKSVCAQARLTERYFYESFSGMEELLIACYRLSVQRLRGELDAAVAAAAPDPPSRMHAALTTYFKRVKAWRTVARIVLYEIEGVSEAADAAYRAELASTVELIRHTICAGLPERPADGLSAQLLCLGFMGAVYQMAKDWVMDDCQGAQSQRVRNAHALFVGMVAQWRGAADAPA